MRDYVRPGQEVKWFFLMARMRVDGDGLKMVPWRKAARPCFVVSSEMALDAKNFGFLSLVGRKGFGASGIFHRPFCGSRLPVMMILPSLMILTLNFVKIAAQSSSQS